MDKNNTHIDDDFLKKLVNLQGEEELPEDFTRKIMAQLPKQEVVAPQPEPKPWFNFRNAGLLVVSAAVVIYLLLSFDISGLFNLATDSSSQNPQNYLRLFTSVLEIFKQGFSSIKITSISITAFLALGLLYGFDKLLKSFTGGHQAKAA